MTKNSPNLQPDRGAAGEFQKNCPRLWPDREQRQYSAAFAAAEAAVRYSRHIAKADTAQNPLIAGFSRPRAKSALPAEPVGDQQKAAIFRNISEVANRN